MDPAVLFAVIGAAVAGAAAACWWIDSPRPDPAAESPAAATAPPPPASGAVSLDGLVQHFLATGAAAPRADDTLPFDQPLAPDAPQPSAGPLSDLVARLPVVPRAEGSAGE